MTYCVGIALKTGMLSCSDSRTNAGVDVVSSYSKMHTFGIDGERQFLLVAAGNLATTQGVILQLKKDIEQRVPVNLMAIPHLDGVADYSGQISLVQQQKHGANSAVFDASWDVALKNAFKTLPPISWGHARDRKGFDHQGF